MPAMPRWARMSILALAAAFTVVLLVVNWTPPAVGASACVVHRDGPGREELYNSCAECRIAKVERTRPGSTFPVSRTYTIPPKSRTQLSFRGPGQTRVVSDTPCDIPDTTQVNPANVPAPTCTQLMRRADGAMLAANVCDSCRLMVLERSMPNGQTEQQSFVIAARGTVPVPSQGATRARILTDSVCR